MPLTRMPGGYVESIRFSLERELEAELREAPRAAASAQVRRPDPEIVTLSEALAPRVHRLAREVADVFGVPDAFELWQTRNFSGHLNAQAMLERSPFAIRLIGPIAKLLDDGALRAMLGHEFGHHVAHGGASPDSPSVNDCFGREASPAVASACSVAAEITADRFGFLACQTLDSAVRLEVALATGDSPEALEVRTHEYLAECCGRVAKRSVPLVNETHPSRDFRLYAVWLFSRSDVCARLLGGKSEVHLTDVDAELGALCRAACVSQSGGRTAVSGPSPAPVPSPPSPWISKEEAKPTSRVSSSEFVATVLAGTAERVAQSGRALLATVEARSAVAVSRHSARTPGPAPGDPPSELELRFRKLERDAEERNAKTAARVPAELERRFRELEEEDARRKD